MSDAMNIGGVRPAVIETPDGAVELSRVVKVDFIHGRRVDFTLQVPVDDMQQTNNVALSGVYYGSPDKAGIPFEVLLIAIVLSGVIIGFTCRAVAVGMIDVDTGARTIGCFVAGFLFRLMIEPR